MKHRIVAVLLAVSVLSACGGGGNSDSTDPTNAVAEPVGEDTVPAPVTPTNPEPQLSVPEPEPTPELESEPNTTPGPEPVAGECVDSPPLNDGFGFNGVESCVLPIVVMETELPAPTSEPGPTPTARPVSGVDLDGYITRFTGTAGVEYFLTDLRQDGSTLFVTMAMDNRSGARIRQGGCEVTLLSGLTVVEGAGGFFENVDRAEVLFDQIIISDVSATDFDSVEFDCSGEPVFAGASIPVPDLDPEIAALAVDDLRGATFFVADITSGIFDGLSGSIALNNTTNTTINTAVCEVSLISGLGIVEAFLVVFEDVGSTAVSFEEAMIFDVNLLDFNRVQLRCDRISFQGEPPLIIDF